MLLLVVALSLTPVDQPAWGVLEQLERVLPGSYAVIEFTSNIALFVPLGVIVARHLRGRMRWAGVAIGAGVSIAFELLQAALLPERFATPWDVAANTIGAAVGVLIVVLVGRRGGSAG
jgi:glycopeptide antibiotics resistance protein